MPRPGFTKTISGNPPKPYRFFKRHRNSSLDPCTSFRTAEYRLNLEHVWRFPSRRHAGHCDKVLCDDLHALIALEARKQHQVSPARLTNHAAAFSLHKPVMRSLLLRFSIAPLLSNAMAMMAKRTYSQRAGRSNPRHPRPKPHKFMANKHR
jgi:hypothetical protein